MADSARVSPSGVTQYLQIQVAPYDLAIPLSFVEQIRGTAAVYPIDRAGDGIDVEGAVVPVIDLAVLLGLPPRSPDRSESVVVLGAAAGTCALRVDHVSEIIELADRNVHDVTGGLEIPSALLAGVALQPAPVAVLDGDRLLAAAGVGAP